MTGRWDPSPCTADARRPAEPGAASPWKPWQICSDRLSGCPAEVHGEADGLVEVVKPGGVVRACGAPRWDPKVFAKGVAAGRMRLSTLRPTTPGPGRYRSPSHPSPGQGWSLHRARLPHVMRLTNHERSSFPSRITPGAFDGRSSRLPPSVAPRTFEGFLHPEESGVGGSTNDLLAN